MLTVRKIKFDSNSCRNILAAFQSGGRRKQLIPEQFVLLFVLLVVFVFVGKNVGIYVKKGKKEEKKDLKVFYASDVYIMMIIIITCGLFVCSFLSLHQFICWFLLPGQIYLIISLCSSTSSS